MSEPALRARWRDFWARLAPDADGEALGTRLLAAWAEPHRAYHTQEHLGECLALLDEAAPLAPSSLAIEAALWFHDAIHDPRAGDNEARSAAWCRDALAAAHVDPAVIDTVTALILATRHAAEPDGPDAALLVDIDLAVLGAAPARFDRYDRDVRREYAHVPALLYRYARRRVLGEFLARPTIYSTQRFRTEREGQARENLRTARRRLLMPWIPA